MSLKTVCSNTLDQASSLGSALLSLKEYMDVAVDKFKRVTMGVAEFSHVSVPVHYVDSQQIAHDTAGIISAQDIRDAIDGEISQIQVQISGTGEIITMTSDEVLDDIQQEVSQLQVQSEFLTVCLQEGEVTAEQFTSSVLQKFSGASSDLVSSYANLLRASDKLSALKSWVSQSTVNTVSYTDDYIEMYNREEYTGVSVWSVVMDDFLDGIVGAFDKVWQGILDIQGFFSRLWEGIKKLGKYLLSKAFRYLTSNLSKSDAKIGILDFPMFQIELGTLVTNDNWLHFAIDLEQPYDDLFSYQYMSYWRAVNMFDHFLRVGDVGTGHYIRVINGIIKNCCHTLVYDPETGDPIKGLFKSCDVIWPVKTTATYSSIVDGLVLRIGVTSQHKVILSIHASMKQQCLDAYDDATIFNFLRICFGDFLTFLSSSDGLNLATSSSFSYGGGTNPDDKVLDKNYYLDSIISQLSVAEDVPDSPIDFASHFKVLCLDDLDFTPITGGHLSYAQGILWTVISGFIPFFALFSPTSEDDGFSYTETVGDSTVRKLEYHFVDGKIPIRNICYYHSTYWESGNAKTTDTEIPLDWNNAYKPYLSYNVTPASIHLQTTSERAKEIEQTIIATVIAVAVTVIAIKLAKFKKNMAIKTEIARGQCDNLAWTMDPTDPTQISAYRKLRAKARRLERFSSLFGLVSHTAATTTASSFLDQNQDSNTKDFDKLYQIIHG